MPPLSQPTCFAAVLFAASCSDIELGSSSQERLVWEFTPFFRAPCYRAANRVGVLAKCDTFRLTGKRSASSCGDGNCYAQASTGEGVFWVVDHARNAVESSIGFLNDTRCASTVDKRS